MVTVGFFVRMEAKPGMETDVEARLKAALSAVEQEPDTTVWLALRLGPSTFAVVDAFPDEEGREAHLAAGRTRLMDRVTELFTETPTIVETEIVAAKISHTVPR